jgi:FkbM family methyltransferase
MREHFCRRHHERTGFAPTGYGPLRARDWSHFIGLMATGYWEQVEVGTVERLTPGRVFWDLGAHYGYYALVARRAGASRIFALEAAPATFASLEETIDVNRIEATLLHAALVPDAQAGDSVDFFVGSAKSSSILSSTHPVPGKFDKVQVPAVTVTSLIEAHGWEPPGLVLVDLEGSEPWIVPQLLTACRESRPDLIVEVNFRACAAHDALPFAFVEALLAARDVVAQIVESRAGYRPITNARDVGDNVNLIAVSQESWERLNDEAV